MCSGGFRGKSAVMRFAWFGLGAGLLALAACSPSALSLAAHGHAWPHTVMTARNGRQQAELDVVSGATAVTVGSARLGNVLMVASTPANSGISPGLTVTGAVRLSLGGTGQPGPAVLNIVLNSQVKWRLVFAGGASLTSVNLGAGRLGSADFAAGSAVINLWLPRPAGTVTVVLAGGASQVRISLPAGIPAQLRLDGGASSATIGGHPYTGVAGGTVLTAPGWAGAASRYQIDAPAGVSAISVSNR
jgi:hypothetical protein